MRTLPGQKKRGSEKITKKLCSIVFCSVLLLLVFLPSLILPQYAKGDSTQPEIIRPGEPIGVRPDRFRNAQGKSVNGANGINSIGPESGHFAEAPALWNETYFGSLDAGMAFHEVKYTPSGNLLAGLLFDETACISKTVPPNVGCTYELDKCSNKVAADPVYPPPLRDHYEFKLTVGGTGLCSQWQVKFIVDPGEDPDWVTITSPASGRGRDDAIIKYTVRPNTEQRTRIGEIVIAIANDKLPYSITQAGTAPQPSCTYNIPAPKSTTIGGAGTGDTEASFTVTTANECSFTALSDVDWIPQANIRISGNTVAYQVEPNPDPSPRDPVGHILIKDPQNNTVDTYTVHQLGSGASVCTYMIALPKSRDFDASGTKNTGSASFTVTTNLASGCPFTAALREPNTVVNWITNIQVAGSMVSYQVQENPDITPRPTPGHIDITDPQTNTVVDTYTVNQLGRSASGCTYTLSQPSNDVSGAGTGDTEASFTVTTASGCSFTAVSDVDWIPQANIRISGGNTVSYKVQENPNTTPRDPAGHILIKDPQNITVATHTVNQQGRASSPFDCAFTLKPQNGFVGETRTSFGFTVTADNGCKWTATPDKNDGLFTIQPDTSTGDGKTEKTVIFTLNPNTDDQAGIKTGDICIRADSEPVNACVKAHNFHIEQAPPGNCPTNSGAAPLPVPITVGQTVYGVLSIKDCTFPSPRSAFSRDRYAFNPPAGKRIAINVASFDKDFDPVVTLFTQTPDGKEEMVENGNDDDGAAFRNVRLPSLPAVDEAHEFMDLPHLEPNQGRYIIEVRSFSPNQRGNYGLLINAEGDPTPKILGVVIDGKTLIVTGENFTKKGSELITELLIGDASEPEKNTQNDKSRTRTALIALKSAGKVKDDCMPLRVQVRNRKTNEIMQMSDVFVYPTCKSTPKVDEPIR